MTIRLIALAFVAILAARADVILSSVSTGGVETPTGTAFDFGTVAQGGSKTVRIRARNNSAALAVQIVVMGASGTGFVMSGAPSLPWVLAPGSAQDFLVTFTPASTSPPGTKYTGNLQVNNVSLLLLATSSTAPVLTVLSGCAATTASAGAAFSGSFDFGQVQVGQLKVCDFQLQNLASSPLTIATLSVTGAAFQGPVGLAPPLTLNPQQSATFSIDLNASQPGVFSGTLSTDTGSYSLTATVPAAPMPLPVLSFDTTLPRSGEQHTLTMSLSSASPLSANGNVNLTFVPDSSLVSSDPAVVFVANGTRTLPFSVKAGSTQVLIGGASSVVFQTGTTSGRIVFTISGVAQGVSGDPTTSLRIAPATVNIQSASFTARPGNLDVSVSGFDNTYTMGAMAFTFYDTSGHALAPGTIQADFTANFRAYFVTSTAGSAFQTLISFPVSGSLANLGSAAVSFANAAGSTTISNLALQ